MTIMHRKTWIVLALALSSMALCLLPTAAFAAQAGHFHSVDQEYPTPYLCSTLGKSSSSLVALTGNGCDSQCSDCECPCPAPCSADDQDTGDPVELAGGEVTLRRVDLKVPGRGLNWEFARRYRSRINYRGHLGFNWDSNYDARLVLDAATGDFTLEDGNAEEGKFTRNPDGSYSSPGGYYVRVTVLTGQVVPNNNDPLEIEVANRHGIRTRYRAVINQPRDHAFATLKPGDPSPRSRTLPLVIVIDRNGNMMRFLHDNPEHPLALTKVIDTLGREYVYEYDSQKRLKTVRDFFGREIVLTYDTNGDLVAVRSPVVTGTPNGNDFLSGKTERYTYSSGFSDSRLNHDLLSVTAPNEVAVSGPPSVVFEYETNTASPNVDRAKKQTLGGTNGSGILAGGDILYSYQRASGPYGAVVLTTVTDRASNVTEYFFDASNHTVAVREHTRGLHVGDPAFFETRHEYSAEGELTRTIYPNGNQVEYVYGSPSDRTQQGNLLAEIRTPASLGGDQTFLTKSFTYEPMFNHRRTMTEERGNDPSYVPQNGGAQSSGRYTTVSTFDYQEGNNLANLAAATGRPQAEIQQLLTVAGISTGLPDQNGDSVTTDPINVCGNVIRIDQPTISLLAGSPQALAEGGAAQELVTTTIYNKFGQVVSKTDPEENVATNIYLPETDPDGDGQNPITTNGAGNPSDPNTGGYLKQTILDASLTTRLIVSDIGRETAQNPALTTIKTDYLYDRVGHVVGLLDGRGVKTSYFVNALDQVVQTTRAADVSAVPGRNGGANGASEDLSGQAYAYKEQVSFDFNGNVVKRLIENRDGNTPDAGSDPGFIEYTYAHDILNDLVTQTEEVSPTVTLTWQYRYDANQNRTRMTYPEGNVFAWAYDERDLLLSHTRGLGDPDAATVTYAYDGNRNLTVYRDAEDNTGDSLPDPLTRIYDGFNRVTTLRDAIGNVTELHYDPASNVIIEKHHGRIGGPSPTNDSGAGNTLLAHTEHAFDELSREFQSDRVLFVSAGVSTTRPVTLQDGPLTPSDLKVTTRTDHDRLARVRFIVADSLHVHRTDYDGVSRVVHTVDPENNEILTAYDDNGNAVRSESIEKHPEGTVATQTFVSLARFDSLNRLTASISNLGHTNRIQYDSRDNAIAISDAQGPPSSETATTTSLVTLNAPGNTSRVFFDGISRVVKTEQDLRVGGGGGGPLDTSNASNPDGVVTITQVWDGNSRLLAKTDDRGNTTSYQYDALNRLTRETFADSTFNSFLHDRDDNVEQMTDANGSVRGCTYDGINRFVRCDVPLVGNVIGTTLQTWEYDGLGRKTRATDNNDPSLTTDDSEVTMVYDSVSRELEEHQILGGNDKIVSWDWQDDDLCKDLIYPNDRRVAYTYDDLDRLKTVTNVSGAPTTGQVAAYQYIGPGRLLQRTYANGIRLTLADDAGVNASGYDGDKRIVSFRHLLGSTLIAGFNYTYDRMDNRLSEERPHMPASKRSDDYMYDSLYRLTDQKRDIPQGGGSPAEERTWTLDGAQNWAQLTILPNGGPSQVLTQSMSPLNSYTSFGGTPQVDDLSGNRVDDGQFTYRWDFLNRLRDVRRISDSALIGVYTYDAYTARGYLNGSGRRIRKTVTNSGALDHDTYFCYDAGSCIEDDVATSTVVVRQFVDGFILDEHLLIDRDTNSDGVVDQTLHYHENSQGWVHGLTDTSGTVMERYAYDAYGKPTFLDATGSLLSGQAASARENPYLRDGYFDPESGIAYCRHRMRSLDQGRWLSRDPIGVWTDSINLGNGYAFVGSGPVNGSDPFGLSDLESLISRRWELEQFLARTKCACESGELQDLKGSISKELAELDQQIASLKNPTQLPPGSGKTPSSPQAPPAGGTTPSTPTVAATIAGGYIGISLAAQGLGPKQAALKLGERAALGVAAAGAAETLTTVAGGATVAEGLAAGGTAAVAAAPIAAAGVAAGAAGYAGYKIGEAVGNAPVAGTNQTVSDWWGVHLYQWAPCLFDW